MNANPNLVGQWYLRRDLGQIFQVTGYDERWGTIEIRPLTEISTRSRKRTGGHYRWHRWRHRRTGPVRWMVWNSKRPTLQAMTATASIRMRKPGKNSPPRLTWTPMWMTGWMPRYRRAIGQLLDYRTAAYVRGETLSGALAGGGQLGGDLSGHRPLPKLTVANLSSTPWICAAMNRSDRTFAASRCTASCSPTSPGDEVGRHQIITFGFD